MTPDSAVPARLPEAGDWTAGRPAIHFQRCGACGGRWLFARAFCPSCGNRDVASLPACGIGTVYAATVVQRAPSAELRARTPYGLVLVDADEGFRLMAHGAPDLAIGARVEARFVPFGGGLVPYFERKELP